MGGRGSRVGPASIKTLIKQLSEVYLPDDRNVVMETLEQMDTRLLNKKTFPADVKELKENGGFYVMLKCIKKLTEDIEIVTLFIQIIESIKMETAVVMDFIQFGGLDVVEKCMRMHSMDEYLAMTTPRILKVVLAIGAKASIEEIRLESTSLQLCHSCQEIIERQKHPLGLAAKISLPKPNDRVNRVLRFMDNYLDRQDVQISGLDAVLKYARNADAKATVRTTDAVAVVSKAAKQHKDSAAVVWRSCLSLSLLAALSSEVSVDVASTNLHDELIGAYPKFMKEPVVQVQIMRLYAALLQWPKSHRMVHKSQAAVDFLKTVAEEVEKAKKKFEEDLREKERLAMLALKMGGPKAKRKAAYVAVTSPPESPRGATAGPAAVEPQQMLPLPVQVVRFVRESGGKAYKEKSGKSKGQTPQKEHKQRRNFDERPKFGTVEDRLFVAGSDGLVQQSGEDDDGNQRRKAADWEAHLQYGEKPDHR